MVRNYYRFYGIMQYVVHCLIQHFKFRGETPFTVIFD